MNTLKSRTRLCNMAEVSWSGICPEEWPRTCWNEETAFGLEIGQEFNMLYSTELNRLL